MELMNAQGCTNLPLPLGCEGVIVSLDPADLPSLPRVDNQHNQDYVDRLQPSNHGRFSPCTSS